RIAEFLLLGLSDHDEGTSFREVHQLRGGCWLSVEADGSISGPCPYWDAPRDLAEDVDDVPGMVRGAIESAVRLQLRSDVPVGSCLSGGLDSGSIAASVSNILGTTASQFTAVTLCNDRFEGDEAAAAAMT